MMAEMKASTTVMIAILRAIEKPTNSTRFGSIRIYKN